MYTVLGYIYKVFIFNRLCEKNKISRFEPAYYISWLAAIAS